MKASVTQSNTNNSAGGRKPYRRQAYHKALDGHKRPIRGLWVRGSRFYARLSIEDEAGRKVVRWAPLAAQTVAEAQAELRRLLAEREENRLRFIGRAPTFGDYLDQTYIPLLAGSGKKPDTLVTEMSHYNRWRKALGGLRLDKIRPSHILAEISQMRAVRSGRTCNVALVCLRHVLKAARRDGFLKTLPTDEIPWQQTERKTRRLYALSDIERVCQAGLTASKNGPQLADFLHFLAYSGAREQEALRIRWTDVDSEHKLLTIGAEGDTKNREARRVDFNPALTAHLEAMAGRRAPDSEWLFPSPQRGDRDARARSLRESLNLARKAAGLERFGFHDCRHHFISFAVMSGIDFMTIARWVGHKDGGILIGKVYGHLSNEHAQQQANRLHFEPVVLGKEASA